MLRIQKMSQSQTKRTTFACRANLHRCIVPCNRCMIPCGAIILINGLPAERKRIWKITSALRASTHTQMSRTFGAISILFDIKLSFFPFLTSFKLKVAYPAIRSNSPSDWLKGDSLHSDDHRSGNCWISNRMTSAGLVLGRNWSLKYTSMSSRAELKQHFPADNKMSLSKV